MVFATFWHGHFAFCMVFAKKEMMEVCIRNMQNLELEGVGGVSVDFNKTPPCDPHKWSFHCPGFAHVLQKI